MLYFYCASIFAFEKVRKNMKEVIINTDFITLGQFLKLADIIQSGGEAKMFLLENEVYINGVLDCRRGRKLRDGDEVVIDNIDYIITKC